MGKSYATLIQEFFVVPPEEAGKFLTWCNIAGLLYDQLPIYKVDMPSPGILQ